MNSSLYNKRSAACVALICVILSTVATNGNAFQNLVHDIKKRNPLKSATSLSTSLSTPTGSNFTNFHDDENENSGRPHNTKKGGTRIQIVPMGQKSHEGRDPNFNEFHKYLKSISQRTKNANTRAFLMDDELKRLESRFYKLTGDDVPQCRLDSTKQSYNGPLFRPDPKCYAMVTNAYSKSQLGRAGALAAENACSRFEQHNPDEHANAFLLKGIVTAWVTAGDFKRAETWLKKMEDTYATTRQPSDAPDMMTYTIFLEALANSNGAFAKDAGERSLNILYSMRRGYLYEGNAQVMPTRRTYVAVMKCQERSHQGIVAANKIRTVFQQLQKDYEVFGSPDSCKPNIDAAMPLVSAAVKCRGNLQAIQHVEEVLESLLAQYEETGDEEYRPLEKMITMLLSAYSKVNSQGAARCSKKVDEIFSILEKNDIAPSIFAVTAAIRAKVNDRSDASLDEAEKMMRKLESPDAVVYQSLIKGYCRNGNAEKAYEMLEELEVACGADVMSMAVSLDAWSKTRKCYDTAIEKSELLLEKIVSKYRMGLVGPHENHVNSWIFEDVARLWLRSRNRGCSDRIAALIDEMETLHKEVPGYFHPTENLFIVALDAISVADQNGGEKALALFDKLQSISDEGVLPPPSLRVSSSLLASLAKSSGRGAVRKTCEIFQAMLQSIENGKSTEALHPRTLSVVFRSILGSTDREAGELAMTILREMVDCARKHSKLISPNTKVFNVVLAGLARKHMPDEAWETLGLMETLANEGFDTMPDVISFSCVAQAIGSARTPLTLERVDSLVSKVFQLYWKGMLTPDTYLFDAILIAYKNSWSLHAKSAERAYNLLIQLEDLSKDDEKLSPDLLSYRTVCDALSKSKIPGASAMCEDVYLRARSLAESGRIAQLDRELYSAAIVSYARNKEDGSLEKAEAIIGEMELRRQTRGSKLGSPDTLLYNRMISAYANSGKDDKTAKALTMFEQMKHAYEEGDMDSKPDIYSYNSLILVASRSSASAPSDDFKIALSNFKALHSDEELPDPNSSTYEYFIRACDRLLPGGDIQTKLIEQAFSLCRQRGLVTPQIVKQSHCLVPSIADELETVKASSFVTVGDKTAGRLEPSSFELIPESWCSSVPEKYRQRKVQLGGCHSESRYF